MPSSGTLKPLVHNIQATIVVIVWAFITLPINFIPVVGQIAWVVLNGLPSGWESHADYFSRKGLGFYHQRRCVLVGSLVRWWPLVPMATPAAWLFVCRAIWAHKWEYWTFGMGKLCMFMVPFVNILFMFTIVVCGLSQSLVVVVLQERCERLLFGCTVMSERISRNIKAHIQVSAALWAVDYEKKLEQRGGSESDIASQPRSYDSMATSAL
jgi:uncharacterized protein involved in cysteine biosynthesis